MNTEYEGKCTCGRLRYRLTAPPMFVHCCHCSWCQRETGSAFAVNALIETGRVEVLQGETETVDTPSASGKGQKIVRCPDCRSIFMLDGTRAAHLDQTDNSLGLEKSPEGFQFNNAPVETAAPSPGIASASR